MYMVGHLHGPIDHKMYTLSLAYSMSLGTMTKASEIPYAERLFRFFRRSGTSGSFWCNALTPNVAGNLSYNAVVARGTQIVARCDD